MMETIDSKKSEVGNLTLVYNLHLPELAQKLTDASM